MAVAQRQDSSQGAGIGVATTSVEATRVGNVELGRAVRNELTVSVPESGMSVIIRNNIYLRTNFFIKESRRFIAGATLRTYWYFRFMPWIFVAYFILILPMPFVPFYVGWPWALATGVIGMVWLIIFAQHAHVIRCTIRKVLSQPILPDSTQEDENAVYEIKLERVEGRYLQAKNSGVGVLATTKGSASEQFHVLNKTAAAKIKMTVVCSIVCLILTIIALCVSGGVFAFRLAIDYRFFARITLGEANLYWPWPASI